MEGALLSWVRPEIRTVLPGFTMLQKREPSTFKIDMVVARASADLLSLSSLDTTQ